ncbi:hypothetical protein MTBPR1_60240 [Candidatus Terasakiella magnetica]|uniref:Uncharacterized protein n=1 Tax=Candidatus Terasakiella magnetica TaxID=1867952 RepID=A0A1C3RKD9_9PROT|nr:hypothetical protein MTBPR1_60240 [Candidatus Terasakiella magnetica]
MIPKLNTPIKAIQSVRLIMHTIVVDLICMVTQDGIIETEKWLEEVDILSYMNRLSGIYS